MRRILIALLALSCLTLSAQMRTRTCTFDISNPSTLSPAINNLGSAAGDSKSLEGLEFKSSDGLVSLSFDRGTSLMNAQIVRGMNLVPYLDIPWGALMTISTHGGTFVTGIRIPPDGVIGGIILKTTNPEMEDGDPIFDHNAAETFFEWPLDYDGRTVELKKNYTSLTFMNGAAAPTEVHKIIVDYLPPRDILVPVGNIATGAVLTAFDGIKLTFDSNMSITKDAVYTLSGGTPLTAAVSGNTVTLTPANAITTDGTYTLTVEAGSFESADGFRNQKLTYTFKVLRSLDITGISLAEGEVESIPAEIILTIDGQVGKVDDSLPVQITDESGVVVATGKASKNDDTNVKLTFDKAVTGNGLYTLTIPEKLVYDDATPDAHYNQKKIYTYRIGDVASAELRAKAAQLLALTGLGYPTASSTARMALASLDAKASTADYNAAITAYLQTTDVELPASSKFYYIAAVAEGGRKAYLQYSGGSISLTTDIKNAAVLRSVANGSSFSFYTIDGKGLLLPGSSESSIGNTAASLTLSKLSVSGVDDESVFGLFSISASGKYAQVDVSTLSLMTSGSLTFIESLSNGFCLEQVNDADLPTPEGSFTEDFTGKYNVNYKENVGLTTPVKDVYLNDMTLYTNENVQICPSDQEVVIVNYRTNAEVARGRFYSVNAEDYVPGAKSAIKLKLNKEITEGSLSTGTYAYMIYAGTFGDENFGLYNTDLPAFLASGKTKADCHVNPYTNFILTVDNERAGQTDPDPGPENPGPNDPKPDDPKPAPEVKYTLSPDGGEIEGANLEITLAFGNVSGVVTADKTLIALTGTDGSVAPSSVTGSSDGTRFVLTFDGLTDGTYVLNIGEGAFTYAFEGRTEKVPAISSEKYTVTVTKHPSEQTVEKAKAALAHEGIGYPAADSPARQALEQLLKAGEGSDDEFEAAISAFIAETDVEKPAADRYYLLKTVGQTDGVTAQARSAYVGLAGNALTLTAADAAAAFMVTANADGTTVLTTVDDRYLGLPSAGDCLSSEYDAESCALTLSRLDVLGVDAAETFGLFSISLGGSLFATADLNGMKVAAPLSAPCLTMLLTSGFTFEEVSGEDIRMPEVAYTLTPEEDATIDIFEKATICFDTNNEVTLKDISQIRLIDRYNADIVYRPIRVTAVEGQDNTFDIEFINVKEHSYKLVIGSSTFVTEFMGREVPIREQDIERHYTIRQSVTENKDLDTGHIHLNSPIGGYVTDNMLNTVTLKADTPIVVIPNAQSACIYRLEIKTGIRGYFEATDDSTVVRLMLENEIEEGTLKPDVYTLYIPAKTFGDANYAQYLADSQSISLALCHVNPEMTITFNVDNSKATGITEVTAGMEGSPVYDLMGRRVSGQLQPGTVYVRDGRKFTYRRK